MLHIFPPLRCIELSEMEHLEYRSKLRTNLVSSLGYTSYKLGKRQLLPCPKTIRQVMRARLLKPAKLAR